MLARDALDGHVQERQIPLAFQVLGAEGGQPTPQGDDLIGQLAGDLVGTAVGRPREFLEAVKLLGLVAPQHGRHGGGEIPRGAFEAVLADVGDPSEAIIKPVFHLTNHVEVSSGSGHSPLILRRSAAALPPHHQGSDLSPPLCTHTLQLHMGDTM